MIQSLFKFIFALALFSGSLGHAQPKKCTDLLGETDLKNSALSHLSFSNKIVVEPMGTNFSQSDTISKMADKNGRLVLFRTIRGKHKTLEQLPKQKQKELLGRDLSYSIDPHLPKMWMNMAFGEGRIGGTKNSEGDWVIIGCYSLDAKTMINPYGAEGRRSILSPQDRLSDTMLGMGEIRIRVADEIVMAEVPLETYLKVLSQYENTSLPVGKFLKELLKQSDAIIR